MQRRHCAGVAPDFITKTCAHDDTTVFVSGTCNGQVGNVGNGYKSITCTDVPGTDWTPVAACSAGTGAGPNYVRTACRTVDVEAEKVVASCTESTDAGFVRTTCRDTTPSTPVQVEECTEGVGAGPTFLHTRCTTGVGSGFKRVYDTKTKITDTDYSGETQIGSTRTISETTTATGSRPTTCAGRLHSPCRSESGAGARRHGSTARAGGSINSLADVAQYYYVTDLRPRRTGRRRLADQRQGQRSVGRRGPRRRPGAAGST